MLTHFLSQTTEADVCRDPRGAAHDRARSKRFSTTNGNLATLPTPQPATARFPRRAGGGLALSPRCCCTLHEQHNQGRKGLSPPPALHRARTQTKRRSRDQNHRRCRCDKQHHLCWGQNVHWQRPQPRARFPRSRPGVPWTPPAGCASCYADRQSGKTGKWEKNPLSGAPGTRSVTVY